MDRQATIGFVLIFILLMGWMYLNSPKPQPAEQKARQSIIAKDTTRSVETKPVSVDVGKRGEDPYGKFFSARSSGSEEIIRVETDLFVAEITSKGGLVKTWELKQYRTWDGRPVQLVDYDRRGDLSVLLTTSDGRLVNTRELYFDTPSSFKNVVLAKEDEFELALSLPASNGGRLVKHFKFKNGSYGLQTAVELQNLGEVIANYEYQVVWEGGLRYAEHNSIDESTIAVAYSYAGKELTEIDAAKVDEKVQKDISGSVDWVGTRTKYFGLAIIPEPGSADGAYLEGTRKMMPDNGAVETYTVALKTPFKGGREEKKTFTVFLGPIDYSVLKSYHVGLENMMNLGWTWLVRPISEYVMLPLFGLLHMVIPNWGLVIIVFSILIKIALHPLTRSSMKSMKKMQALQPLMDEIKEKYKDDPQKMNSAVMNLYKEYGVNPAGGCLPVLLQMPILYALYMVFRSAIDLRQASFVWWIKDLSVPDVIYSLPAHLPVLGIKDISGLSILMGITMFVQQKMTVKDPRQKAMVWMMPIMWVLLFMSFPSGLNLYYTVFNVLAIAQQSYMNKQGGDEPLRKVEPKKKKAGGIFRNIPSSLTKFGKKQ
jgi:YidC/Oxa1 family membrane protein insertase